VHDPLLLLTSRVAPTILTRHLVSLSLLLIPDLRAGSFLV